MPECGNYRPYANTAHSIELYLKRLIDARGKSVRMKLEDDAFFDRESVRYIGGWQTEIVMIQRTRRGNRSADA